MQEKFRHSSVLTLRKIRFGESMKYVYSHLSELLDDDNSEINRHDSLSLFNTNHINLHFRGDVVFYSEREERNLGFKRNPGALIRRYE